ncbi:MAG: hypothetical protein IJW03_05225 [Clostridia bacterium]|nr:hypothetical protein [Clostridia bacterium]
MKYCNKCGNELFDEAVVCPKCGCATEQKKAAESVEQKQTNKNQFLGAILIAAGFLIAAIAAYIALAQI